MNFVAFVEKLLKPVLIIALTLHQTDPSSNILEWIQFVLYIFHC